MNNENLGHPAAKRAKATHTPASLWGGAAARQWVPAGGGWKENEEWFEPGLGRSGLGDGGGRGEGDRCCDA
eukprot:COSAG04_NODE_11346_length_715_cov_0.928571_2_plen_70_part_01